MVLIPTYTESFRQRELLRGRRSLFYFGVAILGFDAKDPDGLPQISACHRDLAEFLEGRPPHHPWRRALVCMSRGTGKSVWTTQTYPLWRGLYIPNFSTKIIENSSDNAKRNHFIPILDLLISSPRADYLQWLFQERIPTGFEGTTREQLKLVQTDPLANPAISYWGIESKFEGAHPDLVVLDDPEGADAEKSLAANDEAWFAFQSSIPLLKHPTRSQILVVITSHGEKPMAWRLRDREMEGRGWQGPQDNASPDCEFKIHWKPVLDERGQSIWPERFTLDYITALSKEDIFDKQYMLRRSSISVSLFNMAAVLGDGGEGIEHEGSGYSRVGADHATIIYPGFDYDRARMGLDHDSPTRRADPSYRPPPVELRSTTLAALRYYIHFDPVHRTLEMRKSPMRKQRPAAPAATVVGISEDFHAFCVDYWVGNGSEEIDEQLEAVFHLYRTWCAAVVTYESVGAQAWLPALLRPREKHEVHWRTPYSTGLLGTSIQLPPMSARMVEADKTNETKEWVYREVLGTWVNRAILHLPRTERDGPRSEIIAQLSNVMSPQQKVDLVDCLAQGPKVWAPPVAADGHVRRFGEYVELVNRKLAQVGQAVAGGGWRGRTGYRAPDWGSGRGAR